MLNLQFKFVHMGNAEVRRLGQLGEKVSSIFYLKQSSHGLNKAFYHPESYSRFMLIFSLSVSLHNLSSFSIPLAAKSFVLFCLSKH